MERFAELLGCTEKCASVQFICEYDFNILKYDSPNLITLFCDEDYLFILIRFIVAGRYYRASMSAFLIKDLDSDIRNELPQIMETHRNNKISNDVGSTISALLWRSGETYKELVLNEELWERFYKLVVGTTRCKSARNFLQTFSKSFI
jgi:hypothetical protein